MRNVDFLLGLLAAGRPTFVAAEDLDGPHGDAIRRWQELGFIGRDSGRQPHQTCPYCEGVPYRAEGRFVCDACRSGIDERELLAWPVHRDAFLTALAAHLGLPDGVGAIDGGLWALGTARIDGQPVVCFCHLGGPLSQPERAELARYRHSLVLSVQSPPSDSFGRWVSLAAVIDPDGDFAPVTIADLYRERGPVRFDEASGTLRVGVTVVGEVPLGSREWAFLSALTEQLGQFVSYGELKRAVLRRTAGRGDTDEATFCQKLKSRIKAKYMPGIDRLVVTSNKGDGYRLRAEGGVS